MIPPTIAQDAPPGEKTLFAALATDPVASNWVVLHSLALSSHVRQTQGEVDFVVLAPGKGVLVLEVKSHTSIARTDEGIWKMGSQAPTHRGPFQQADEGMHSILRFVKSRGFDYAGAVFTSAVWFTGVHARKTLPESLEWNSWQLLDQADLAHVGASIAKTLAAGLAHLRAKYPNVAVDLDANRVSSLTKLLRPRFDLVREPSEDSKMRKAVLVSLMDEQYDALDAMAVSPRVMFEGPAGTGKTLLAIEAARRQSRAGESGRLVCFNRLLGREIAASCSDIDGVRAGTLHSLLMEIAGHRWTLDPDDPDWDELVLAATDALLENPQPLDYLIVDEAQDLVRPDFLDVLDLLVHGGLRGGRCYFFGDFDRQSVYLSGDGRDELLKRAPDLVEFALTVNCRNFPRIGALVEILSHMEPGYRRYRREDDGAQPAYFWFATGIDSSERPLRTCSTRASNPRRSSC